MELETFRKLLASKFAETVINTLIAIYAVLLAIESSAGTQFIFWLKWIEFKIVLVLCVEIILRALVRPREEFRSGWFYFDLFTTGLAFVPGYEAFRALRLIRILSGNKKNRIALEQMVRAMKLAMPELHIGGILLLVNALVSHKAFAEVMPDRFAEFGSALLAAHCIIFLDELWVAYSTLFQVNFLAALMHGLISLFVTAIILPKVIVRVIEASKHD